MNTRYAASSGPKHYTEKAGAYQFDACFQNQHGTRHAHNQKWLAAEESEYTLTCARSEYAQRNGEDWRYIGRWNFPMISLVIVIEVRVTCEMLAISIAILGENNVRFKRFTNDINGIFSRNS